MPKVEVSRTHKLSMEEARQKIERVAADLSQKYGLSASWAGNRLQFRRTGATGHIQLEEGRVSVLVDLSFVLGALKGKVEERVKQKLDDEFK